VPDTLDPFLLLIGEHDKGHGVPFSLATVSGRRLRTMTAALEIAVEFSNMGTPRRTMPTARRIAYLCRRASAACAVVFLGRRVERELRPYIPQGCYLPHPAARRTADLALLRDGLQRLAIDSERVFNAP
jgi:hypothetical protein